MNIVEILLYQGYVGRVSVDLGHYIHYMHVVVSHIDHQSGQRQHDGCVSVSVFIQKITVKIKNLLLGNLILYLQRIDCVSLDER